MILNKRRRAQVTIFLIIGVVLLFSTAILLYIRGRVGAAPEFKPVLEEVPMEVQPAKLFVEACVKDTTKRAIRLLGLQGGYIDPTDPDLSGRSFRTSYRPTESEMLTMFEDTDSYIPYWWYMDSPNTCPGACEFNSGMPRLYKTDGLDSIETQVDKYVRKNLKGCLGDFKSLTGQGFTVKPAGELTTDFRVGENDVAILVEYPLIVGKNGRDTEIKNYFVRFDVPLKQMYTLASDITNEEIKHGLLGHHTMNLISQYSKPFGEDRLPPIMEVTLGYSDFYVWTRSDVQDKLEKYVLPQGMAMLTVSGTRNHAHKNIYDVNGNIDTLSTAMMDNTVFGIENDPSFLDIGVNFIYLDWWEAYLNINNKEVLKPTSLMNDLIPFINPKTYKFLYDVSFPVVVMITAPDALKEDQGGYQFFFALEVNVRKNKPMNDSYRSGAIGLGLEAIQCKKEQRNSGVVNVTVKELYSDAPVERARVDVKYGNNVCFIGFTDENGVLSDKFPVGNAELIINKKNYVTYRAAIGTLYNQSAEIEAPLVKEFSVDARIKTKRLTFMPGTGGTYALINPDDPKAEGNIVGKRKGMLTMKRIDDDSYKGYQVFGVYDGEKREMSKMRAIPGHYEVKGELISNEGLVIDEHTVVYEMPFAEDKEITLNRTELDQWLEGGLILEDGLSIELSEDALLKNKTIIFYLLQFPIPMVQSRMVGDAPDLTQVGKHKEYSSLYSEYLQPRVLE